MSVAVRENAEEMVTVPTTPYVHGNNYSDFVTAGHVRIIAGNVHGDVYMGSKSRAGRSAIPLQDLSNRDANEDVSQRAYLLVLASKVCIDTMIETWRPTRRPMAGSSIRMQQHFRDGFVHRRVFSGSMASLDRGSPPS